MWLQLWYTWPTTKEIKIEISFLRRNDYKTALKMKITQF